MKELDNFLKNNKPKKKVSKLDNFTTEIMELHHKNYQVEQIQEFLKAQKIEISTRRIYKFIKHNLTSKNFSLQNLSAKGTNKKTQTKSKTVAISKDSQPDKAMQNFLNKMQKIAENTTEE